MNRREKSSCFRSFSSQEFQNWSDKYNGMKQTVQKIKVRKKQYGLQLFVKANQEE